MARTLYILQRQIDSSFRACLFSQVNKRTLFRSTLLLCGQVLILSQKGHAFPFCFHHLPESGRFGVETSFIMQLPCSYALYVRTLYMFLFLFTFFSSVVTAKQRRFNGISLKSRRYSEISKNS